MNYSGFDETDKADKTTKTVETDEVQGEIFFATG